jgi:hypothetical protein
MRSNRLPMVIALILGSMSAVTVGSRASRPSQQTPQARKPGLKKLDAWSGRWTTQGKLYDTAYSHAGSITITMTCGWSAYSGYMICDHLFNGPAGKSNDLSVYTYDSADNSYKFYSVDQTGPPRSVPLTIEGDIWTYNSEMEKDGKKILIRTINDFSKPGVVAWNTKFSADAGAHWTLMNEGVDTKVR